MSIPENPPSGDSDRQHLSKIMKQVVDHMIVTPPSHDVDKGVQSIQSRVARVLHAEKIRSLKPRLLSIDSQSPEASPDLLQMRRLYELNTVPNEAFEDLATGNIAGFKHAVTRGGMLNHFKPSEEELDHYGPGYETIEQQIINDLLRDPQHPERSLSGRPGTYHVIGLMDSSDILRAYLSFRLPPHPVDFASHEEYVKALDEYEMFLVHTLFNPDQRQYMQYAFGWDPSLTRKQLRSMWEIDTYNVEQEWGGSAAILTRDVLQFVKDRFGNLSPSKYSVPSAVYCYRFRGLQTKDEDSNQLVAEGPNVKSRAFLESIGFIEMAVRSNPADIVYRTLSNSINKPGVHKFLSEWQFLYNGQNKIQRLLHAQMHKNGLLQPGEPLLTERPREWGGNQHQAKTFDWSV